MTTHEVREHVIGTADALFYGRGIQAVGMDVLKAESGVSLKRLYTLFPSKEAIVLAVLERRHSLWSQGLETAIEEATSPHDRLLAVYDYLADWFCVESFRGCGFINAFGELGAVSPHVADAVRSHKRSFQERLTRLVHDIGGSSELAAQLAILAEGAQTTAAISGSPDAAGQARRAAESLIALSDAGLRSALAARS